ncbi:MAG: CoA-binding protein [Planctomycetes bacterium]|nr:CoA-binding protein [Planctomycetota bacterium]
MAWQNPEDATLRAILERTRTIALVGASSKSERPSHGVMRYLLSAGYEVIPIRPGGGEVLGLPCVASLTDLDEPPDLIDVFRASEHVAGIVEAAIALQAPVVWLQDGVVDEAAAGRAQEAGLIVVMDECTLRVHRRLVADS